MQSVYSCISLVHALHAVHVSVWRAAAMGIADHRECVPCALQAEVPISPARPQSRLAEAIHSAWLLFTAVFPLNPTHRSLGLRTSTGGFKKLGACFCSICVKDGVGGGGLR